MIRVFMRDFGLGILALGVFMVACWSFLRITGKSRLELAMARFSSEVGSLEPSDYAPAVIPPDINIALKLLNGMAFLTLTDDDVTFLKHLAGLSAMQWTLKEEALLKELLLRNEKAIETLAGAGDLIHSSFELNYHDVNELRLPSIGQLLSAHRLMLCKAKTELRSKKIDDALNSALVCERIASALQGESILVCMLAGALVEKEYLEFVQELLSILKTEQLLRLQDQFAHLDSLRTPLRKALGVEGVSVYKILIEYPESFDAACWGDVCAAHELFLSLNREGYAASVLQLYSDIVVASAKPFALAPDPFFEPFSEFSTEWYIQKGVLSKLPDVIAWYQGVRSAHQVARVAVHIHQFFLKNGALPLSLSFVPSTLLVSYYTGERMHYDLNDRSAEISFPDALRLLRHKSEAFRNGIPPLVWSIY
jgi:hypothetical protein